MRNRDEAIGWRGALLATLIFAASAFVLLGAGAYLWPELNGFSTCAPFAAALCAPLMLLALRTKDALLRRAELAAVGVALAMGIILAGPELARAFPTVTTAAASTRGEMRIVTLNVWDHNPNPARVIRFLKRQNADVIILQEAREPLVAALRGALTSYPTFVTCAEEAYCGVTIIARAPAQLLEGGMWTGSPPPQDVMAAQPLRYAAVLMRWSDEGVRREIPLAAVHIYRSGQVGPANYQLSTLATHVNALPGAGGAILAGDFNSASWSASLHDFDQSVPLQRLTHLMFSWPARLATGLSTPPVLAIDQIYAGPAWGVVSVQRGPDVGSDHFPLIATLRWQGG